MYSISNRTRILSIFLFIGLFLTGCGDSPQPALDAGISQEEEASYQLTELEVPDPQAALTDQLWENGVWQSEAWKEMNWKYREESSVFWEGSWYLFSHLYVPDSGTAATCVQVLAPPYDHWESYAISHNWPQESSDYRIVENLAGVAENGVLLEVRYVEEDRRQLEYYRWDGMETTLLGIPENLQGANWGQKEDGLVAAGGSRLLAVYDEEGQERFSGYLTGRVVGMLSNPATGELFPYGFEREELVLWNQTDGQVSSRITDQIGAYDEFAMAISDTGEILLADMYRAWLYREENDELQELFAFMDLEYPPDQIYGCAFGEDGAFLFFVEYDGEKHILTAQMRESSQETEKQEITLCMYGDQALQRVAIWYNRQSEKYHVRVIGPKNSEEKEDYRRRMLLEVSTGGGPELLTEDVLAHWTSDSMTTYLEPLDGIVEDMSPFIESAFEAGKIEDRIYGIPIRCYPSALAVSRQIAAGASWTLEEMMEAVRASETVVLQYGCSGVGIVMYYGLYDEENKSFIDWENGESHLTEQPFLDLLAFAREYAYTGQYEPDEAMECLADGRIAGIELWVGSSGDLNKVKSCFKGEGRLIGYPRESGDGIYMHTYMLYMNKSAANKEGAEDFLRYLLSEEGQRRYSEYGSLGGMRPFMVRRSVNEQVIEEYQQNVTDPPIRHGDGAGFSWEMTALDEEQIEQFWWMMDNAVPDNVPAADLWAIVEEELQPYFNGDRSAEQAAVTLDSRVQVYLDERK